MYFVFYLIFREMRNLQIDVHMCACLMMYNSTTMFLFSLFFWCPCMAINVSVQYDGGLLPDIKLLTQ